MFSKSLQHKGLPLFRLDEVKATTSGLLAAARRLGRGGSPVERPLLPGSFVAVRSALRLKAHPVFADEPNKSGRWPRYRSRTAPRRLTHFIHKQRNGPSPKPRNSTSLDFIGTGGILTKVKDYLRWLVSDDLAS